MTFYCLGLICTTYISCTIAYPYQSFPILPCRQVASKCHPHTTILSFGYNIESLRGILSISLILGYLSLYHTYRSCTFFCLGSLYDLHSCVSTQGLNERCTARPLRESVLCVPTSLSFFLYPLFLYPIYPFSSNPIV